MLLEVLPFCTDGACAHLHLICLKHAERSWCEVSLTLGALQSCGVSSCALGTSAAWARLCGLRRAHQGTHGTLGNRMQGALRPSGPSGPDHAENESGGVCFFFFAVFSQTGTWNGTGPF